MRIALNHGAVKPGLRWLRCRHFDQARDEKISCFTGELLNMAIGDFDGVANTVYRLLNTFGGNAGVGRGCEYQAISEPVKKMGPQDGRMVTVKCPLHSDCRAAVNLHQRLIAKLFIYTGHVGLPQHSSELEKIVFPFTPAAHQLMAAAFTAPDTLAVVELINFKLALILAIRICATDFLLEVHAIINGTAQSSESAAGVAF